MNVNVVPALVIVPALDLALESAIEASHLCRGSDHARPDLALQAQAVQGAHARHRHVCLAAGEHVLDVDDGLSKEI